MAITKLPSEIKIGAAEVLWNDVTIGHTEEGQVLTLTKDLVPRLVDQFGSSEVDHVIMGEHVRLEVQVAQSALDILLIAFPELTDGTGDYGMAGSKPGTKMSAKAQTLILRPYGASGVTEDVTIHKAIAIEAGPIPFSNDGDRVTPVAFVGLLDTTKGEGNRLYKLAMPQAGA